MSRDYTKFSYGFFMRLSRAKFSHGGSSENFLKFDNRENKNAKI